MRVASVSISIAVVALSAACAKAVSVDLSKDGVLNLIETRAQGLRSSRLHVRKILFETADDPRSRMAKLASQLDESAENLSDIVMAALVPPHVRPVRITTVQRGDRFKSQPQGALTYFGAGPYVIRGRRHPQNYQVDVYDAAKFPERVVQLRDLWVDCSIFLNFELTDVRRDEATGGVAVDFDEPGQVRWTLHLNKDGWVQRVEGSNIGGEQFATSWSIGATETSGYRVPRAVIVDYPRSTGTHLETISSPPS